MSISWRIIWFIWGVAVVAIVGCGLSIAFDGKPMETQYGPPYGGGPYRPDPRDWGPDERARRMPPPRGGYPIIRDPCIAYGDCAGRRPPMPPFPGPPGRYDLYGDEQ